MTAKSNSIPQLKKTVLKFKAQRNVDGTKKQSVLKRKDKRPFSKDQSELIQTKRRERQVLIRLMNAELL